MAEATKRTSYEAAAAWDTCRSRDRGEAPFAGDLLVLDLDLGGAGVCRCAGNGHIELLGETQGAPIPDVSACLGIPWEKDPAWDRTLRVYLRGKGRLDPPVGTLPDQRTIHCSEVERLFEDHIGPALSNLLERTGELLDRLGIDRLALRILPVGALASMVLAEHRIRANFSADPFLPDARFADLEGADPAAIVAQGMALYAAGTVEPRKLLGHDVALCLLEGWGFGLPVRPVERPLAKRDTPLEELAKPTFTEPFFLDAGEPLRVVVDGEKYDLFQAAFPKGLLALPVQAGLRADETGMFLVLRGQALPDLENHELPIPVK